MGPKKAADDGSDMSMEKFYAAYKKECTKWGFKPEKQVTEKYNDALENGNFITRLNLSEKLGWQGVKAIMDSFLDPKVNYQHIQTIRLWGTMAQDEGARAVCRYISVNPSTIVLELNQEGVTALGCQFIGKMLNKANPASKCNLTILKLDHNPIGSLGMKFLAEGLRQNKNIQQLSITYGRIDVEGAQSIAEVLLFQGSVLEEIDLGGNFLKNDGTIVVLKAAAAAKNLKRISLQDNQFMEEDNVLDAMGHCMKKNVNLARYNFKYNFLGNYGVEKIIEHLAEAPHVADVEIPERISKEVMEAFQAAKAANKPKKGKGGKKKKKK